MNVTGPPAAADLAPTAFLDSDHPEVVAFAQRVTAPAQDDVGRARLLFAAVRDGIFYDTSTLPVDPAEYRASAVLRAGRAYCVPKSILLSASARAVGIPARLGFADVRNHLQTERLREQMGTDLFHWHGYSVLHVGGEWRKASSAFNAELCARFGVPPLDFDGTSDALLHAFSGDGSRYMEYPADHGAFADLPYETLMRTFREAYPGLAAAGA